MRCCLILLAFSFFCQSVVAEYTIPLTDPFKASRANTQLFYSLDRFSSQIVSANFSCEFIRNPLIISSTLFTTYVSHELGHVRVGNLYGRTYNEFPYYNKQFLYTPTDEQYLFETAAGPNQQEQNARWAWEQTFYTSDYQRSFNFLLNKLTSPVYFFFTRNLNYWNRGFSAPYAYYNVFGDHNFYIKLLNRMGNSTGKSELLQEIFLTNFLSAANWSHWRYWGALTLGTPAEYSPALFTLGNTTMTYPLISLYLLETGPYYQVSFLGETQSGDRLGADLGFPGGVFTTSTEKNIFLALDRLFILNDTVSCKPSLTCMYNSTSGSFSLSRYGLDTGWRVTKSWSLHTALEMNNHDWMATKVRQQANGVSLQVYFSDY